MKKLHHVTPVERDRIVDILSGELAKHPEISFAYLHGSFADSLSFHDVDIGVYLRNPSENARMAVTLLHELSSALKLPVDVRILNGAPLSFTYHVLRGLLLTSQDDELLASFIERTVQRYLDRAPLLRRATKEAFAK